MKRTLASICAHDVDIKVTTQPHVLPIMATAAFDFTSVQEGIDIFTGKKEGHVYSRYGNPTIEAVARKISKLEAFDLGEEVHTEMVSTGMAAVSTLFLSIFKPGDIVLTQGNIYGGTIELFLKVMEQLNIHIQLVSFNDLDVVAQIMATNSKIKGVFVESPSNPNQDIIDLKALTELAHTHDVRVIVDNTLPTPIFQRPFNFGVDFIIHSTTKFLNGHGNAIGGCIIGKDIGLMKDRVHTQIKLLGTTPSPFDVWLLHNGMKTLHIRMERQGDNALALASYLEGHHAISRVNYSGLASHENHKLASRQMSGYGALMSVELKDGMQGALNFLDKLKLCSLTPTLGDVDTLVLHPATSSHLRVAKEVRLQNGITDGLIRINVGLEDINDLIADIDQALD